MSLGDLTQGQVVALYNYMSQILVELVKLANMIITITKALACASRIQGVLQLEPTLKHTEDDKAGDSDVAVAFDDVTLQYKNAGDAVLGSTFPLPCLGVALWVLSAAPAAAKAAWCP